MEIRFNTRLLILIFVGLFFTTLMTACSSGDETKSVSPSPPVSVADVSAGFTISSISGATAEDGSQATFTVKLTRQPTADVMIPLSSSDITEGTVSVSALTFTITDWDADQTITVTGVDDFSADGDQAYTIILGTTASDDTDYNGLDPDAVSVTNTDMGDTGAGTDTTATPGFTIGTISGHTAEPNTTATFTVKLISEPAADVVIALSSSDTSEGTVSPTSLTFTSANWNTDQTVTVTGVDDAIFDGNNSYTILLGAATSSDSSYSGLDPSDVAVVNDDNDWKLSDSGLAICYDDSASFACPSSGAAHYGQDGNYSINLHSFITFDSDTVTDNNTGLVWQRQYVDQVYDFNGAGTYCTNLNLGGKSSGWRVPTVTELLGIADYGTSGPAINVSFFPGTTSQDYRSSTALVSDST
ncbi:MAG: DUF1566 domain-containing protein, partial [SAR324 cluster bacterium]|nr:DUF1566 domain-containing protein [SAR324 cluster bacterium]